MPKHHPIVAPAVQEVLPGFGEPGSAPETIVSLDGEAWREIPGRPGYDVSDLGRVRSWWEQYNPRAFVGSQRRIAPVPRLMPIIRRKGSPYLRVHLYEPGHGCVPRSIHELVLEAFVGPRTAKDTVGRHLDGNATNNRLDNLRWGTRRENMLDAIRCGRATQYRLTEDDIPPIWEAICSRKTNVAVANEFGISIMMVSMIKNGVTWSHITEKLPGRRPKKIAALDGPIHAPKEILDAEEEIWREVRERPVYQVSSQGRIFSGWTNQFMKSWSVRGGYQIVELSRSSHDQKAFLVHRLVLEAFAGPCPDGMEGCHADGNPANNHIRNLRWDTHSANRIDTYSSTGTSHTRMTPDGVRAIRRRLEAGETPREVAESLGVSQHLIRKIRRGKSWAHVS